MAAEIFLCLVLKRGIKNWERTAGSRLLKTLVITLVP